MLALHRPEPHLRRVDTPDPVEREIREGGVATVYLTKDLKHNRSVALKVPRRSSPPLGTVSSLFSVS